MKTKRLFGIGLVVGLLLVLAGDALAFYNPQTGRWLNRDPIGEQGFRAMLKTSHRTDNRGIPMYATVANNPINQVDFLGLRADPPSGPAIHCEDPCKWARENASPTEAGVTVCCNGKMYACVNKPGGYGNATDPIAQGIIGGCIMVHEQMHVSDPNLKCPKHPCGWTGPMYAEYDKAWTKRHGECEAYSAEISCLHAGRERCNGDAGCEAQVDAQIAIAQAAADSNCSPVNY